MRFLRMFGGISSLQYADGNIIHLFMWVINVELNWRAADSSKPAQETHTHLPILTTKKIQFSYLYSCGLKLSGLSGMMAKPENNNDEDETNFFFLFDRHKTTQTNTFNIKTHISFTTT